MLNLQSQKTSRNSRGRKFFKQSVCSFNKFQDFIVAKSKQKTPNAFFVDRHAMTGQIKIQKLNFSNTASEGQFLPPKSVDKFYKSSTNRSGFTVPRQQLLMSQTQTPIHKTKIWSFESTNEEYLPKPQQIKTKIESNAMQRFQQLFKKQTSIRAKRIQEEQSKRLMRFLESTGRKQQDNRNSNKNFGQSQNGYINYGNVSKKKLNQQENNLTESTNLQRQLGQQTDLKMKAKQSIKNPRVLLNQANKTIDRETINRQGQAIDKKRKNSFFKQKNYVQQGKEINKKTINIDDCIKNVQIAKEQLQKAKKVIKRTQSYQEQMPQDVKEEIKRQKVEQGLRKSQPKEENRQPQLRQSKKEQVYRMKEKTIAESKETNKRQVKVIQPKLTQQNFTKHKTEYNEAKQLKQSQKQQYNKKNSFNAEQIDALDLLPTAEVVQKPQPSIKQISNDKPKLEEKNTKQQNRKDQDQKGKVSLEELMKNNYNDRQRTQQNSLAQNSNKPKTPILINGAKQVRSAKNQVIPPKQSHRHYNDYNNDHDDIEELQEVSIVAKVSRKKVEEEKKQTQMTKSKNVETQNNNEFKGNNDKEASSKANITNSKANITNSNSNIKPSTSTSLANELQNSKKDIGSAQNSKKEMGNAQKPQQNQSNNTLITSLTKLQPSTTITKQQAQSKPQSQQKVQFNDSSQGESSPADQLGYLLDLVQTLGSYYTDSKHFYSQPDSSMIQIIMNHKLAAFFLAQQYYFYIHLFQKCSQQKNKDGFYSLSGEEFEDALQDEEMVEGIEELKKSSQLAVKLIRMTFEKCKMYHKKHQKQLNISPQLNYHKQCIEYLKAQFSNLYNLYLQKTTSSLGKRLCYLIQTYGLVMYLNQEEVKQYKDVEDIEPQLYTKHVNKYKHLMGV